MNKNRAPQEYIDARLSFVTEAAFSKILELNSRNDLHARKLDYVAKNYYSSLKNLVENNVSKWHFPLSLPFHLFKYWKNENITWVPRRLGGKSYASVISVYEKSGLPGVKKFLYAHKYTPFIMASAYTALCRKLHADGNRGAMLACARKAYNIEPKHFRLKWYALRLNDAGYVKQAGAFLRLLEGEYYFSDTEQKINNEIQVNALAMEIYEGILKNLLHLNDQFSKSAISTGESLFFNFLPQQGENLYRNCAAIVRTHKGNRSLAAFRLLELAAMSSEDPDAQFKLVRLAALVSPNPLGLAALFAVSIRKNNYWEAFKSFEKLKKMQLPQKFLRDFLNRIKKSQLAQLELFQNIPATSRIKKFCSIPNRVCYVMHNSFPWSSGGYASRGHGIAKGLRDCGYEMIALTRPGYPLDIVPGIDEKDIDNVPFVLDGIEYMRIPKPLSKGIPPLEYIKSSALVLRKKFEKLKPEIVIAASNYLTGLPALMACRELGIPFIYEVRGLWEITRISREPAFANTASFFIQKIFEARVCCMANHVLTLTGGMKKELESRGVPAKSISLAYNACDPDSFMPRPRDVVLAQKYGIPADVPVIGYIGTFVVYEGLDDLLDACALLKDQGYPFRLLLVGNENASGSNHGGIMAELERKAAENGFKEWLIMPGRIPHAQVAAHYSLIDIAPFPRKPWPVCEIVSPMKPMEAMSMGKAVLVSSVDALREMIADGETGLIFEKGNTVDLARKLEILISSPELRQKLGANATNFIRRNRSWTRVTSEIDAIIKKILRQDSKMSF